MNDTNEIHLLIRRRSSIISQAR